MRPRRDRAARLAWVALLFALLIPIWWGAHQPNAWDVDNIAPGSVLRALAVHFGPGWYSSYGPVPYLVTALLYVPMLLGMRLAGELGRPVAEYPWGFVHPDVSMPILVIAARLITVALALGVAYSLAHGARAPRASAVRDPARGWIVPLLLIGAPAFAYYARTTNVDMHYLFWLAIGFMLLETPAAGARRLCAAAACAALAVCSKEQSAPFAFALALGALWNAARRPGPPPQRVRDVLLVGVTGLATYVAVWLLPINIEGWRQHHHFVFEVARYDRVYPLTGSGFMALANRGLQLLPTAFGWPILAGLAAAIVVRPFVRDLGWRALGALLYLLGFMLPVGYVYARFLLPLLLLAVPIAARAVDAALSRYGTRRAAAVLVALTLAVLALPGAPHLAAVQIDDTRHAVRRWLEREVPAGASVEVAGNPRFQATVPARLTLIATATTALKSIPAAPRGDVVLVSSLDRWSLERAALGGSAYWDLLNAADGAYQPPIVFSPRHALGSATHLFVSPTVHVFVRRGHAGAPPVPAAVPAVP